MTSAPFGGPIEVCADAGAAVKKQAIRQQKSKDFNSFK
jgi:hypothetical protein